jgi:branched-chain amino acid transport system ATP-binding protein
MAERPMLELRGVTGGYGLAPVLHGLDLSVRAGETVAVLGPNGAGKSTLMGAITGTIRQRGGTILFAGEEIVRRPSHAIVEAGLVLVPEGRQIFAPFTVADNLRLGAVRLKAGGKRSVPERYDYVYSLFPRLAERRRQLAGTLSGGEQQMLAIGRALMSAPRMLLLDEPFLGLAPLIVAEIRRALDALKAEGLTILLVEQKLDIVLAAAARAYVMIKGRLVLESDTATLSQRPDLNQLYFSLAEPR